MIACTTYLETRFHMANGPERQVLTGCNRGSSRSFLRRVMHMLKYYYHGELPCGSNCASSLHLLEDNRSAKTAGWQQHEEQGSNLTLVALPAPPHRLAASF